MRFLWTLHCILGAYLLHGNRAESREDNISQADLRASLFPLFPNFTLMDDSAAAFGVMDDEELSNVCAITVLINALTVPSEHEAINPVTEDDLKPVKGLLNGSSSVLEGLASVVNAEVGKVSYQSLITETVLDIKQQNEQSNNIMTEISQTLDADPTSDKHVTKFKEKVCRMESMLQAIDHLARQVKQMSDTLSTELKQHLGKSHKMESTLYQKQN
ncbi:uncharacterized protein LOC121272109 [Carcharodon carcharias]|uniref:uncharacterized protein LOC121272109 n=1 Tax=Carcharodon carcharias TaxID=13397 RepID=UPI001B7E7036|nr:uncharacterized protein LOC121272109 [Carcharodon carcharias]